MSKDVRKNSISRQSDNNEEENLWNRFQIDFQRIAQEFPDNNIYGTIRIEPDAARQLIRNFTLLINDHNQGELEVDSRNILISGFDTRRTSQIRVRIRANPIDKKWKSMKKESKPCTFSFKKQFIALNPVVSFEWSNDEPNAVVVIRWHPINDQSIKMYDVVIDDKTIRHIKERSSNDDIQIYIHSIAPGTTCTVKILAKMRNGKVKYQSNSIPFTVPFETADEIMEPLSIQTANFPETLQSIINTENVIAIDSSQFKVNAFELLQKLRKQIENRKRQLK